MASALAYATQQPNGTRSLNFSGIGPNVYDPSTYSYLLLKTTGSDPALGAVANAFVNYALTLGQQSAPSFGYATLGLSLERYGVDEVSRMSGGSCPHSRRAKCVRMRGPHPYGSGGRTDDANLRSHHSASGRDRRLAHHHAPNGPFSSGQAVVVSVAANSNLSPNLGLYIEECSAPGGSVPTLPTQCDANLINTGPLFANSDGSVDYKGYPMYALPDAPNLGETSAGGPVCDLGDQCVLYVVRPDDFSQPHVWSSAFFVKPTTGDSGTNPGNGLPEVPFIVALPLLATVVIGGVTLLRRRRGVRAAR